MKTYLLTHILQVSISTEGRDKEVIPFQKVEGSSAVLTETASLHDGHSYVVLLKVGSAQSFVSLSHTFSHPVPTSRTIGSTQPVQ